MRALLIVLLYLPLLASADDPVITINKPDKIVPSGQGFVTVTATFMKVVRLYVDGLYQGRRYLPNPKGGKKATVRFLVSYPGTAAKGRYTLRVEGKDSDGEEIEAIERFVSPTVDRDVQVELTIRSAQRSVTAPPASLFTKDTSVVVDPDAKYKVVISPSKVVVVPGQKVEFTVQVFDGGTEIINPAVTLSADTGSFLRKTYTASDKIGRHRIVAKFGDGIISAQLDIAKPIDITVVTWGIHRVVLSRATFADLTTHVDPNIRPTTKLKGGVVPADKGKRIKILVEGQDAEGDLLTSRSVQVDVR